MIGVIVAIQNLMNYCHEYKCILSWHLLFTILILKNITLALLLLIFTITRMYDDDMRLQLFNIILNNVEAASAHHP